MSITNSRLGTFETVLAQTQDLELRQTSRDWSHFKIGLHKLKTFTWGCDLRINCGPLSPDWLIIMTELLDPYSPCNRGVIATLYYIAIIIVLL